MGRWLDLVAKSPSERIETQPRIELTKPSKPVSSVLSVRSMASFENSSHDGDEFEDVDEDVDKECPGTCASVVPAIYHGAWERLKRRKPLFESDAEWRLALSDGGLFLDRWGHYAALWGWTAGDLFDAPSSPLNRGLIWWLQGSPVITLDDRTAIFRDGTAFYERAIR